MWFSSNALGHGNLLEQNSSWGSHFVEITKSSGHSACQWDGFHKLQPLNTTGYPQRTKLEEIWTPLYYFQLKLDAKTANA